MHVYWPVTGEFTSAGRRRRSLCRAASGRTLDAVDNGQQKGMIMGNAAAGAGPGMTGAMMARIAAWELLASAAEPDRATRGETLTELWDLVGRYRKALYDLLMSNMITAPAPPGPGRPAAASRPGSREAVSAGAAGHHERAAAR